MLIETTGLKILYTSNNYFKIKTLKQLNGDYNKFNRKLKQ